MNPDQSWFTDRGTDGANKLRSLWASALVTFVAMWSYLDMVNTTPDIKESMGGSYNKM